MYRFVEAERDGECSVNKACAVLEVSRAAYYEWSKQEPSAQVNRGPKKLGRSGILGECSGPFR